jgi:hypothetical protein
MPGCGSVSATPPPAPHASRCFNSVAVWTCEPFVSVDNTNICCHKYAVELPWSRLVEMVTWIMSCGLTVYTNITFTWGNIYWHSVYWQSLAVATAWDCIAWVCVWVCGNGLVFRLKGVLKSAIANLFISWGINLENWRRYFCNINGRIKKGKDKRSAKLLAGSLKYAQSYRKL